MAAAFSPSSKAMRPASNVETAGELKKRHKKWKSGHKDKIAFSGQTKGVRRILRLISDHLVPAWVEPLWSPSHRTIEGQASRTRRDTAADTLLSLFVQKPPAIANMSFISKKKSFFWAKSFEEYTGLRPKVIVWPPLLEPTSEELGGWRQAIRRGKQNRDFQPNQGRYNDSEAKWWSFWPTWKVSSRRGPFPQAPAQPGKHLIQELLMLETFHQGNDKLLWPTKNMSMYYLQQKLSKARSLNV